MVTVQEIQQREEELNKTEQQARLLVNKPIPQRRFGVSVTKQQQIDVIKQRQQAKDVLSQVDEQRKQLNNLKSQLSQEEQQTATTRSEIEQFDYGRKLGLKGASPIGLTSIEKKGYRGAQADIQAFEERKKQLQALSEVGLSKKTLTEANLQNLTPEQLSALQDAGLIKVESQMNVTNVSAQTVNEFKKQSQVIVQQKNSIDKAIINLIKPKLYPSKLEGEQTLYIVNLAQKKLFSEESKKQIGISLPLSPYKPIVTLQDIKTYVSTKGIPGGTKTTKLISPVLAEFIPVTPGEVLLNVGAIKGYNVLPKAGRIIVSGGISIYEIKNTLNPKLTTEKRIASGIVGGLAGAGAIFESLPIIKGGLNRLSPNFKPVQTQPEGFKGIQFEENTAIGLIPEKAPLKIGLTKDIELPDISPLKKGAFGFKQGIKSIFLGPEQFLATSQRGLFKQGVEIALEKEFFVTPQEPFLKIPITRISRLGIEDLFRVPKDVEYGLGLPDTPQIGLLKRGIVKVSESPRAFKIGLGSELEAIKSYGTITNVKKIGVTTLKGQGIDIFEFAIGPNKKTQLTNIKPFTTMPISRISGEGLFSLTLVTKTSNLPIYAITSLLPKSKQTSTKLSPITLSPPNLTTPSTKPSINIITPSLGNPTRRTPTTITPPTIITTFPTIPSSPPTIKVPPSRPPSRPPSLKITPYSPPRKKQPKPIFNFFYPTKKASVSFGFKTFFIKKGKKVFLPGIFPKATALKRGESLTLSSVARTFGVKPTKIRVKSGNINYKPSPGLFRSYKVRKGRAFPLRDIYIERLGKKQLSFLGKKNTIQMKGGLF